MASSTYMSPDFCQNDPSHPRWLGSIPCPICYPARMNNYRKWNSKGNGAKRYCVLGHDKAEVGVTADYQCAKCHRDLNKLYKRKRTPEPMLYMRGLREAREALGITLTEFADLTSIDRKNLSLIERGKRQARASTRKKIVEALVESSQGGYR